MKILAINGGASGSSWNICQSILVNAKNKGHFVWVATPDKKPSDCEIDYYRIGNKFNRLLNRFITRCDGSDGFHNSFSTLRLIKFINSIKPDIVHLHTLHGYFINVKILVEYLEKKGIKIVITCHDCWWFTGRCSHFFASGCEKWKTGCMNCLFKSVYPKSLLFDKAYKFYLLKQKLFCNHKNVFVVCVSEWLSTLCRQSLIFNGKEIVTIHNGVDSTIFKPSKQTPIINTKQKVILSVSSQWNESKGLPLIIEISKRVPDYRFLLVGKLKKGSYPSNIQNIPNISSKEELASLYCSSDLLLNASLQETFSIVNIEAQMCGLPVVCLRETGMKETVSNYCFTVQDYSVESYCNAIEETIFSNINRVNLIEFANNFSQEIMNEKYLSLYEKEIETNE